MQNFNMNSSTFSDVTLMAFADGQLDAETAAAVQAVAQADKAIARRIALFKDTAQLARQAHTQASPAVPDALMASVLESIAKSKSQALSEAVTAATTTATVPTPAMPGDRATSEQPIVTVVLGKAAVANQGYWALVASVTSVAVGVLAFLAGRSSMPAPQLALTAPAGIVLTTDAAQLQQWQNALTQLPSGQTRELAQASGAARMGMLASFRDSSGALCREFSWNVSQLPAIAGVACQDSATVTASSTKGWRLVYAAAALHSDTGYAPASASAALDAYVVSVGGGPVLSEEQEREALKALDSP